MSKARAAKQTIHFVSLGCPKNRVDTEVMLGVSDESGLPAGERAGRRRGDRRQHLRLHRGGQAGVDRHHPSISRHEEERQLQEAGRRGLPVAALPGRARQRDARGRPLPRLERHARARRVLRASGTPPPRMLVGNPADYVFSSSDPRRLSMGKHSAYVKIAEGCSRNCSFCAIPSFRGKQRSRPIADVVGEVAAPVRRGHGRDQPGQPGHDLVRPRPRRRDAISRALVRGAGRGRQPALAARCSTSIPTR